MRANQVFCLFIKRVVKANFHRYVGEYEGVNTFAPKSCFIQKSTKCRKNKFSFLNESVGFDIANIDWVCSNMPKLWRYNLHYFDYLNADGFTQETKNQLILSWIQNNKIGAIDAWEPYTVSLRIVNWIKYFTSSDLEVPIQWKESLFLQMLWLEKNLECHILANHYLKNATALYFSGKYFKGTDARRIYKKSLALLSGQLVEQFFYDGGHYEKSPMYHSICLEDIIDVINIAGSANNFDKDLLDKCTKVSQKGLEFLSGVQMPDGEISFFNDSALNIAPHPELIFDYAEQVFDHKRKPDTDEQSVTLFNESGLFIIKDKYSKCIIDCGSISPAYQPGHTHCDLLSYELAIGGQRCIVNSGLYDYENSIERRHCRSTRAHNTVEIDGKEQSEVWGQFRVARRAKVLSVSLGQQSDADVTSVFKGCYSPYWSEKENIVHSREVKYRDNKWTFSDVVRGNGVHKVRNFIHIHPDIDCVNSNGEYFLVKDTNKLAKITFSDSVNVSLESGWYHPEFGIKIKKPVFLLMNNGPLPIEQSYTIESL